MATGISRTKWAGEIELPVNGVVDAVRLDYSGKREPANVLETCPRLASRIVAEGAETHGPRNRLYFGENLGVLGSLLDEPLVRGKVSLVYIDPPYSTNSIFESRTQKSAYHDLLAGSAFVDFLRERLIILKELLSDAGSIYLHLDQKMVFPFKLVMDEVFGAANFRNFITRKKCNPKNYTRKTYGNIADHILFYSKSDNYIWHRPVIAWDHESGKREYTYTDVVTGRRFKKVPLHAPGVRNGQTGKPWRKMLPPPGKHWQFSPSTLEEMDRRGEIYWSTNGNPRRKIYLDESDGIPVQDIWMDFKDAHNQNIQVTGYPTEKNMGMLDQIIHASSTEGDLVLDCFAGSGTTLAACSRLGRKWIGIDNSSEAIQTILNRLMLGTRPMGDFVQNRKVRPVSPDVLPLFPEEELELGGAESSHQAITDFALYQTEDVDTVPLSLHLLTAKDHGIGVLRDIRRLPLRERRAKKRSCA